MTRLYGLVLFSLLGVLGIILEASPTIRVYPETVVAGSVARLVIRDLKWHMEVMEVLRPETESEPQL